MCLFWIPLSSKTSKYDEKQTSENHRRLIKFTRTVKVFHGLDVFSHLVVYTSTFSSLKTERAANLILQRALF